MPNYDYRIATFRQPFEVPFDASEHGCVLGRRTSQEERIADNTCKQQSNVLRFGRKPPPRQYGSCPRTNHEEIESR
jgi:hypothetical protein